MLIILILLRVTPISDAIPKIRSMNLNSTKRISVTDLQQAIQKTKATTSPGCCGWTQPDLQCVPVALVETLVMLWNELLDGTRQWPSTLNVAKVVTPKKKSITKSMMDVRPITILSLLYRILSKTWTKKLLSKIATFASWPIQRSLAHRLPQDLYMFLH